MTRGRMAARCFHTCPQVFWACLPPDDTLRSCGTLTLILAVWAALLGRLLSSFTELILMLHHQRLICSGCLVNQMTDSLEVLLWPLSKRVLCFLYTLSPLLWWVDSIIWLCLRRLWAKCHLSFQLLGTYFLNRSLWEVVSFFNLTTVFQHWSFSANLKHCGPHQHPSKVAVVCTYTFVCNAKNAWCPRREKKIKILASLSLEINMTGLSRLLCWKK